MQPSKEHVAAVIVTYHPPATLPALVSAIRPQVGRVLVIDNAPRALELGGVDVIANASNLGQAAALNQGCEWAREQGLEWVLFLDQDTAVLPGLVDSLSACWRPGVGLVGAGREGVHTGTGGREASFVITAGSLLCLHAYRDAGPFRSELFIDWVDHEYSWRLQDCGWKVLQSLRPGMKHDWGSGESIRLMGIPLRLENYPPRRRYFIVRNWVYVCTRYFVRRPLEATLRLCRLLRQLIKVLLLEPQRLEKARAIWLGLRDGLRGRLGPAPF